MSNTLRYLINYKRNRTSFKVFFPSLVLIIFFFTELISKFLKLHEFSFTRVSAVVKLVIEIFIFFYLFLYKKKAFISLVKIFLVFGVIFVLGHFFLLKDDISERLLKNIHVYNGYLLIFVFFYALNPYTSREREILCEQLEYLDRSIRIIFILNICFIISGIIYDINLFKTYYGADRFGYNGGFMLTSHSSYIYIIFNIYFYFKYLVTKSIYNLSFFLMSFVMAFLLGAKTVYLFIFLFLLYILYQKVNFYKFIFILLLCTLLTFFSIPFLIELLKSKFGILYRVYLNNGFISMIFSYRDINLTDNMIPYIRDYWSSYNYFFGGAEFDNKRTEFQLFDLFWFWGIIGSFVYAVIYFKKILRFLIMPKVLMIPILIMFLCVFLSGSFLSNAPVVSYFIILSFSVSNYTFIR